MLRSKTKIIFEMKNCNDNSISLRRREQSKTSIFGANSVRQVLSDLMLAVQTRRHL